MKVQLYIQKIIRTMGIVLRDKRFLNTLCRLKISPTQWWFMYLLHTKNYPAMLQYIEEVKPFPKADIEDLLERGFIIDLNRPEGEVWADLFSLTDKGQTLMFIHTNDAGEELWAKYPNFIMVDAARVSAKTVDKDDLMETYADIISHNPVYHRRVLELLEYAIRNGMINMGIEKWVRSRQWESLEELMDREEDTRYGEQEV